MPMSDILGILIVLSIVLAVVTVIGHGIWLLGALIVRAVIGSASPPARLGKRCHACGAMQVVGGKCLGCGAIAAETPSEREDLQATRRQLNRLHVSGSIDDALFARLRGLLVEAEARLDQGAAPPLPTSLPTSVPAATPERGTVSRPLATEPAEIAVEAEVIEALPPVPRPASAAARMPAAAPVPPAAPPVAPVEPVRSWADVLLAFMEERNIRWGELISGLLIVLSSVGLVISLRHTIRSLSEANPFVPAFLFMLGTAAMHAAGIYTLRRWKLRATSRGVLVIAMLLIPLNFLAAVFLAGSGDERLAAGDPMVLAAITLGLLGFGAMTYYSSRALVGEGWWRMSVAVMGTSGSQLIINRLSHGDMSALGFAALMLLPLASYLVAVGSQLYRASSWRRLSPRRVEQTFLVLGIGTFSFTAAVCLLVSKADSTFLALSRLSPELSLSAAAVLASGLLVHNRAATKLAGVRTAGTSLAIAAGMLMLASVGLAWPQPGLLVCVGLVSFVALSMMAVLGSLPALHGGAIASLALAAVVGFHLVQGSFAGFEEQLSRRMVWLLLLGRTSAVIAVVAGVVAGAGTAIMHWGRRATGLVYLASAASLAAIGILVACYAGFSGKAGIDGWMATPLLAFYAAALLAMATVRPHIALSWSGSSGLLLAVLHALMFNPPLAEWLLSHRLAPIRPFPAALLIHATLAMVVAGVVRKGLRWSTAAAPEDRTMQVGDVEDHDRSTLWPQVVVPLSQSALATSLAATPFALWVVDLRFSVPAALALWIALVWLATWLVCRWPAVLAAFQTMAAAALALFVSHVCQRQGWWENNLLDPRHLYAQVSVLGVWCALWSVGRRQARRTRLEQFISSSLPPVDALILGAITLLLVANSAALCRPGVLAEFGIPSSLASSSETSFVAPGVGAWIALAAVVVALAMSVGERWSPPALVGLLVAAAAVPLLVSAPFAPLAAVASALRWSLGVYSVVMVALFFIPRRNAEWLRRAAALEGEPLSQRDCQALSAAVVGLCGVPVLILTTWSVVRAAMGMAPPGPVATTWFARIGPTVSYAVPLGLLVVALMALSIRYRSAVTMLTGSGVFQYGVNLAWLLPVFQSATAMDAGVISELLQWNTLGLAAYGCLWLLTEGVGPQLLGRPWQRPPVGRSLLDLQTGLMLVALGVLLSACAGVVILYPGTRTLAATQLRSPLTPIAVVLAAIACAVRVRRELPGQLVHFAAVLGLSVGVVAAILATGWDDPGHWVGQHVLTACWLALAVAATAGGWLAARVGRSNRPAPANVPAAASPSGRLPRWAGELLDSGPLFLWAWLAGSAVVGIAVLGSGTDPQRPWWQSGATLAVATLVAVSGICTRSRRCAYSCTLFVEIAVVLLWMGIWRSIDAQGVVTLTQMMLGTAALVAGGWLAVEIFYVRRKLEPFDTRAAIVPVHQLVGVLATSALLLAVSAGMTITTAMRLVGGAPGFEVGGPGGYLATALVGMLLVGTLWDRCSLHVGGSMYAWGLALSALLLEELNVRASLELHVTFVLGGLVAAAYVAITAQVWRFCATLVESRTRLPFPNGALIVQRAETWLPGVNMLVAAVVIVFEFGVVLSYQERWMRMCAAFAPVLLAYGTTMLSLGAKRPGLKLAALLLASLAGVYLSWADMAPSGQGHVWLARLVRLLIALSAFAFLYGVVGTRLIERAGPWFDAMRRAAGAIGATALVVLGTVLAGEAALFEPGVGAPIETPYVAAVALMLVALVVALLSLALLPGRDPLGMAEKGRTAYVYGAELVAALLFAHLYLSNPALFEGILRPYWPYVVMALAFAGVGAGELFHRQGIGVLAEPLRRTGAFLPLLPALGFWVVAARGPYSSLLFVVGLLYVVLSICRGSFASRLAAALAGNLALWSLLAEQGFALWDNPQFWLIPPAISVLIGAQLNRRHLTQQQLTAIRYSCVLVIYLSSTGQMFLAGIGEHLWPPMVLALLSVVGVMLGIVLRIRAFLYLGSSFLLFSVITMVWHASRSIEHSWPWWAFGIGMGLLILVLFGVFEQKRAQITDLVERLRQWER